MADGQERHLEFDVGQLGTDSKGRQLLGATTLGVGEADRVTLDRRAASDPDPEVARTQRVWLVLHEVSHTLHEVAANRRQGVARPCLRARADEHAYLSFRYKAANIKDRAFYSEQLEGVEPSKLLDAGDWLWVADMAAGSLSADDADETRRQLKSPPRRWKRS